MYKKVLIVIIVSTFSCKMLTENKETLCISGRIEANEYFAANKYPGRLLKVYHDEGDFVTEGTLLAELDHREAEEKFNRAKSQYTAMLSRLKAKQRELELLENKLKAMMANLSQLNEEVSIGIKVARNRLKICEKNRNIAKLQVAKIKSIFEKASKDFKRFKKLYEKKVIPEIDFDKARTKLKTASADLSISKENLLKAEYDLEVAQENLLLAMSKRKEIAALKHRINALKATIAAKKEEIKITESMVNSSRATMDEARIILDETKIYSPVDGIIMEKNAEPGSVLPEGYRIFTIYNPRNIYFEGYIPEKQLAKVKIGQKWTLSVDTYPDKKFQAIVSFISERAEFTPKEVQTKEERVKQVFRIKMKLPENPEYILKPGMPADVCLEK